ncbi:Probable ubiquinol-cytochrome c reductase cytochrome c subunit [Mycobacteroides abscessus subsp. abscessus]|nr:Probable ubiquinol-cytochrome c reductase cytochrome c subunit [Mycobacteroides abscessus subsp. abscessus]
MLLLIALVVAGGLASTFTPTPQVAVADEDKSALLRTGKQLYETSCITCHGANLQGVPDRGPSLIGVGEAAVYFQVSTGRMPAMRNEAQAQRKEGTTIAGSAYGSTFYLATGFHGLHVIGGLVAFVYLLIRTRMSKFTPAQATSAIVVSYYWHFVDIVWIALFATIYFVR